MCFLHTIIDLTKIILFLKINVTTLNFHFVYVFTELISVHQEFKGRQCIHRTKSNWEAQIPVYISNFCFSFFDSNAYCAQLQIL